MHRIPQAGALWVAEERGAFAPGRPEPKQEPSYQPAFGPIWQRASMDVDTIVILAAICGCTVDEFDKRYTNYPDDVRRTAARITRESIASDDY